ncbi:hypothetical protein GCM10020000_77700 [Streptomyces olivoverticillatus]
MHRLAYTGGAEALLHWLSVRSGTWTAIVDAAGSIRLACRQHFTSMAAELAVLGAAELTSRGARSVVLDSGKSVALVYALGGRRQPRTVRSLSRSGIAPTPGCPRCSPMRWCP